MNSPAPGCRGTRSVSCAGAAGLILGADVTAFRFCVLALALLTGAGIWLLAPGRHRVQ